jgi:ABC-type branched-subunit amino acid transport system substrate-binding protein
MDRLPLRVGVLHDFPRPDGGALFEWAVRLGIGEVDVTGRLPAPVTFLHEPAHGGHDHPIERAFARLVDGGVLAILGPALTDGALAVRSLADDAGVPCIHYAGTDEARSAYLFHFQIGSLEDEPSLLIEDLARRRLTRIALIQDTSRVGNRMAAFFADAAAMARCTIAAHALVEPDGSDSAALVAGVRHSAPDALAFVGFWRAAHAVAREMRAQSWNVPAVANSALMYGHADSAWARDWEGWTYADTFSDANPRFAALSRTAAAAGRVAGPGEAGAYDMGRLLAEGIARAPELTRAGVRAGLERVKALPAATGRAGTLMGFGNWDRGALKGPYLVLREWRAGESVEHREPAP